MLERRLQIQALLNYSHAYIQKVQCHAVMVDVFSPAGANNQKYGSSFSQLNEVHLNLAHCYMGCTVNFSSLKI